MRTTRLSGAIVVVLFCGSACSFRVGSGVGQPTQPAPAPPPPAAAPPPAPAPPPAAPAAPAPAPRLKGGFGKMGRAPAPPPAAPAANAAVGGFGKFGKVPSAPPTPAVAPVVPAVVAPNVVALRGLSGRMPKKCGQQEMAPGTWVRLDCHAYNPSKRAINHLSVRKASLVRARQTTFKPFRFSPRMTNALSAFRGKKAGGERAGGENPVDVIKTVAAEAYPGTVDHRQGLEGPVKSQGAVGSCTAFSLSTTIDNAAIRAGKLSPSSATGASSANHVWSNYGIPQMGTAADATVGKSIAALTIWPQNNPEACMLSSPEYEDCDRAYPGAKPGSWRSNPVVLGKYNQANARPSFKVNVFERLQTLPPNIDELVQALATGTSLWVAFKIDGSKWSNSQMVNGVIQDWTNWSGGHAVVMSGYRQTPAGRQYLIHNSWGTSWGDKGYAWLSEAMVQKYMHYAYKVKIEGGVKKEDMTDDDCAPDELLDAITGACAPICAGSKRPSNGCTG